MSTGYQRRHAGITANLAATDDAQALYTEAARTALAECVRVGESFTADDVHRRIPPEAGRDRTNNVVPSLLGVLSAAGVIRRVGEVNSSRPSRHGSRNQVWIASHQYDERGRP